MCEYKTSKSIIKKIREYLFENFLFGYEENELDNNASFLELGVLDSTGIMEVVAFIEREFDAEVLDSEIIPENLDSVSFIRDFILKKISNTESGK